MLILPELRVVEAHELLGADPVGIADDAQHEVDIAPARFALADLRRRGRYLSALQAPTYDQAAAWIGDQVLPQLPIVANDLPIDVDGVDVWSELARSNGEWAHGVQRRSRMKCAAFERLLATGEQQGLLFRLPRWREPGRQERDQSKLYVSDPGVLHRLLRWNERIYRGGPLGVGAGRVETFWRQRDKSWEGFVVSSLIRAAGPRATAAVWESNPGEIDLILDWDSETWAIEVTRGRMKRFREFHGHGHRATGASRPIILVFDDEVGLPELKGASRLGHRVEWMTLADALRAARAGP